MNELELWDARAEVDLGTEKVVVRELRWVDALRFLERLAQGIDVFLGPDGIKPDGTLSLNVAKLREAVVNGGDLANDLLQKSTGLPAERLEALSASQGLVLLDAALKVNLRDDFFGKLRALGESLRVALKLPGATPR